jgi:hypothetical protein
MKWGMVSIGYKSYERFLCQWLENIADLNTKPDKVVIAVESLDFRLSKKAKSVDCEIHLAPPPYNMGKMRNFVINKCDTEWIFYLSIDDKVLPHAIDEFNDIIETDDPDVIMIKWYTIGLGKKKGTHTSVTPYENHVNRKSGGKGGFMIAQSPFKRKFWKNRPYQEHDLPNAPFMADLTEQGAKFAKGLTPVTVYQRRADSHARTELKKIKREAVAEKRNAEIRIDEHYNSIDL